MESGKKRKPDEEYKGINFELAELAGMRKRRKQTSYPKDGSTIYITKLRFIQTNPQHALEFRQLLYEDLCELSENPPKTIQAIFMTTFCFTETFLAPILQSGIPVCLVSHGKSAKMQEIFQGFTVIYPRLVNQWGSFHAKLLLIKFPDTLRIVICSANMREVDWDELGQVIWFQDVPKGRDKGKFYDDLVDFLGNIVPPRYSLERDLGIDLASYDFSQIKVDFVASVPGRHTDTAKYGLGKMRGITENSGSTNAFTFQCSSLGNYTENDILSFKRCFSANPRARMELIFPTFRTVSESFNGISGGGSTFLREAHYNSERFPKTALRDLTPPQNYPSYTGHLLHSKALITHDTNKITEKSVIYIGSHNLSAAAWGRFEKQGAQLFISNYEVGVVFREQGKEEKKAIVSRMPFGFPGKEYEEGDTPWFQEHYFE